MKNSIQVVALLVLMSSCSKPKLSNLHRGKYTPIFSKNSLETIKPNALRVRLSVIPIETKVQKIEKQYFLGLRDSIPHVFMNHVFEKTQNFNDYINGLRTTVTEEKVETKTAPPEIDLSKISVRLILTNVKKYYEDVRLIHPNTRMVALNSNLKIDDPNFVIEKIDRLVNEFEEIDLGTINRSNNTTFKSTLSGGIGAEFTNENLRTSGVINNLENTDSSTRNTYLDSLLIMSEILKNVNSTNNNSSWTKNNKRSLSKTLKAELSFINEDQLKEELKLRFQKIKTGFSFTQNEITLSQSSQQLGEISENLFVTITLKPIKNPGRARILMINSTLSGDGQFKNPDQMVFNFPSIRYNVFNEKSPTAIKIKGTFGGLIRSVKNSRFSSQSILEFDDKVEYLKINEADIDEVEVPIRIEKVLIPQVIIKNKHYDIIFSDNSLSSIQIKLLNSSNSVNDFESWMRNLLSEECDSKLRISDKITILLKNGNDKIVLIGTKDKTSKIPEGAEFLLDYSFKRDKKNTEITNQGDHDETSRSKSEMNKPLEIKLSYAMKGISSIENNDDNFILVSDRLQENKGIQNLQFKLGGMKVETNSELKLSGSNVESFRFDPNNSSIYYFSIEQDNGSSTIFNSSGRQIYQNHDNNLIKPNAGLESLAFDSRNNLWTVFEAPDDDRNYHAVKVPKARLEKKRNKGSDIEEFSFKIDGTQCSSDSQFWISEILFSGDGNDQKEGVLILGRCKQGEKYITSILKGTFGTDEKFRVIKNFESTNNYEGMCWTDKSKTAVYIMSDSEDSGDTYIAEIKVSEND